MILLVNWGLSGVDNPINKVTAEISYIDNLNMMQDIKENYFHPTIIFQNEMNEISITLPDIEPPIRLCNH